MRTTIEIKPEHREKLAGLAASRGERGFSKIIGEALENYLQSLKSNKKDAERLEELAGSISPEEAEAMQKLVRECREEPWRTF
ncbi:MAG: hypothetical protein HYZ37_12485 [Candidatus Solibacter usitatus]|nr:hypothetical protein [Candidatus Solibacter usitatus]